MLKPNCIWLTHRFTEIINFILIYFYPKKRQFIQTILCWNLFKWVLTGTCKITGDRMRVFGLLVGPALICSDSCIRVLHKCILANHSFESRHSHTPEGGVHVNRRISYDTWNRFWQRWKYSVDAVFFSDETFRLLLTLKGNILLFFGWHSNSFVNIYFCRSVGLPLKPQ